MKGQRLKRQPTHSLRCPAYPHQPYVDTLCILLPCRCRPKLVLTGTSILLYLSSYHVTTNLQICGWKCSEDKSDFFYSENKLRRYNYSKTRIILFDSIYMNANGHNSCLLLSYRLTSLDERNVTKKEINKTLQNKEPCKPIPHFEVLTTHYWPVSLQWSRDYIPHVPFAPAGGVYYSAVADSLIPECCKYEEIIQSALQFSSHCQWNGTVISGYSSYFIDELYVRNEDGWPGI